MHLPSPKVRSFVRADSRRTLLIQSQLVLRPPAEGWLRILYLWAREKGNVTTRTPAWSPFGRSTVARIAPGRVILYHHLRISSGEAEYDTTDPPPLAVPRRNIHSEDPKHRDALVASTYAAPPRLRKSARSALSLRSLHVLGTSFCVYSSSSRGSRLPLLPSFSRGPRLPRGDPIAPSCCCCCCFSCSFLPFLSLAAFTPLV